MQEGKASGLGLLPLWTKFLQLFEVQINQSDQKKEKAGHAQPPQTSLLPSKRDAVLIRVQAVSLQLDTCTFSLPDPLKQHSSWEFRSSLQSFLLEWKLRVLGDALGEGTIPEVAT